MSFFGFHSLIERWFRSRFAAPTEPQERGWPVIAAGGHVLIAAPTGSGKTLTAFLACIDRLHKESLVGGLADEVRVVYVSPLRALSNDMHRNLDEPLREMAELAAAEHSEFCPIRVGLRTGDTSSSQRAALVRRPPHILVTTPESLYLMLTGPRSRQTLRNVDTIIIDEIHALVRDKRGSHLSLTVERLDALTTRPLQRIGLSATQKPIERTAEFLVGAKRCQEPFRGRKPRGLFEPNDREKVPDTFLPCTIIDVGHQRELDLAVETPASELGAVCSHEQWAEVNERLRQLIESHRSTLIFVNNRRTAERLTHQLTELLGEEAVSSHHGSLSAEFRLKTERRLKTGELKAVVATASLELGIDVGYIDLVIQIGSPRAIATFLQRIGRSGHSLGLIPKGRLFALTRDELLECMALMRAIKAGRLDVVRIPEAPLDILAQQIVAETSAEDWGSDELFALCRRAYPYRKLSREDFDKTVEFLSEGISKAVGRSRVYLHHDHVGKRIRARKGARIAATSNAGAIPDIANYRVVAEPERTVVGSLDEDFAVESMAGDVFLLGNTSWRILHVRGTDVTVFDAHGAPPTIPFWLGEAPGRTLELSEEVSRLREELDQRLSQLSVGRIANPSVEKADLSNESVRSESPAAPDSEYSVLSTQYSVLSLEAVDDADVQPSDGLAIRPTEDLIRWLAAETNTSLENAKQIIDYAAAQKAAIGLLPTQQRVVFERFFDESGGMQLVVHAPFGGQINRAWGLAMRKRFCRSFDFELQATADDDGFILSLGPQHSFPIESLFPMLTRQNARGLLEQAVLAAPMFESRWRWNVTRALLVLRRQNGKKVPPALLRFRADDLLTAVFPRLTGCQEEHTGDIPIPDHPLVRQTMEDSLFEAVDIEGLHGVLERVQAGAITFVARDTREPSPFSYELLNANPYAFLDGGELQERRARAVSTRRTLGVESPDDLGRLDPLAIEQVRAEAQPAVRDADELHDLLLTRLLLPCDEILHDEVTRTLPASGSLSPCQRWFTELTVAGRATEIMLPDNRKAWVATERFPAIQAVFPGATPTPPIEVPPTVRHDWPDTEARTALVRGLIEISGPITAEDIARRLCITESQAAASLEALEGEGLVLRGRFTPALTEQQSEEWREGDTSRARQEAGDASDDPASLRARLVDAIEWCHRRLLARIHRLTLQGLRAEIEPVGVDVFQRFLLQHHGVAAGHRRSGANGLFDVVAMLQGLDVPVVCWERDLLPARIGDYSPAFLDELCTNGEVGWGRLNPAKRDPDRGRPMASLTRVAPISLFLREDGDWLAGDSSPVEWDSLSTPAQQVVEILQVRGATFAADLMAETRMLPSQLNDVLGELVTNGIVNADGFGGLRTLIADRTESESGNARRTGLVRRRNTIGTTGRWSVWREPVGRIANPSVAEGPCSPDGLAIRPTESQLTHADVVEQWAWQLLRRWGVVFRDLLIRESSTPRWYELLQVYRRLEARGEIRGGRFIAGVGGEQFAAGDTVRQLRKLRTEEDDGTVVVLSAADPLNLAGIITPGPRIPSTAANQVVYRKGRAVARIQSGEIEFADDVTGPERQLVAQALAGDAAWPTLPASVRKLAASATASDAPAPRETLDQTADQRPTTPRRRKRPKQPQYPGGIPRPRY
jgi:ATP-dependent helicase Lhr and Lhr-like helicase